MSWLQLVVLCTWLSVAMIFAARMMGGIAESLTLVAGKIQEQEGRIDELQQEVEQLKD